MAKINEFENPSIDIDVNVDTDKLEEVVDQFDKIDTKTRIEVKNKGDVYMTINNFNCTNEEYLKEE